MNVSKKTVFLVAMLFVISVAFAATAAFTISKYIYDADKDNYITLDMTKCQQLATAVNLTYQTVSTNTCKVWGIDYALALIYLKHPELIDSTTPVCAAGATQCLNSNTQQTCGDYNGDGYVEWGQDTTCTLGCVNDVCSGPCWVTSYVQPGSTTLYDSISQGQTKIVTGSFVVKNTDAGTRQVTISLPGTSSLVGRTTFSQSSFSLAPGEQRTINFYVNVSSSLLTYEGIVSIVYKGCGLSVPALMPLNIILTPLACKASGSSCSAGTECCSEICSGQLQSIMLYGPNITTSASFICPSTGYTTCELYQTKTAGELKPMTPVLVNTCTPGKTCKYYGTYAEFIGYGKFGANVCS